MNKTDLVVSFDTAKALWNAGLRLKTVFTWINTQNHAWQLVETLGLGIIEYSQSYPAPTFAELWAVIPITIMIDCKLYFLTVRKFHNLTSRLYETAIAYDDIKHAESVIDISNPNPAEVLAQMVLWLLEQGYLKV